VLDELIQVEIVAARNFDFVFVSRVRNNWIDASLKPKQNEVIVIGLLSQKKFMSSLKIDVEKFFLAFEAKILKKFKRKIVKNRENSSICFLKKAKNFSFISEQQLFD
jgi:hypothetical protein